MPLDYAAVSGNLATLKFFFAPSPNFTRNPLRLASTLDLAAEGDHVEAIHAILEHGVDVNVQVHEGGGSALHRATRFGSVSTVQALIHAGADVNIRSGSYDGMTPLHEAAKHSTHKNEVLFFLLRHGADPTATTNSGSTALHLAMGFEESDIDTTVDLLLRWGGSEKAVNDEGNTPVEVHEETQYVVEGIDRALELLENAAVDRVWRRRGWLVMARARIEREGSANQGGSCSSMRGGNNRRTLREQGLRGSAKVRCEEGGVHSTGSTGCTAGLDLRGLLGALMGLEVEEAFRVVVGYL